MRSGDRLLIDFDAMIPNLKDEWNHDDIFKPDLVFDRAEWLKKENYIKYVKKEENYCIGGLNPGHYFAMDNWSMTLRTTLS